MNAVGAHVGGCLILLLLIVLLGSELPKPGDCAESATSKPIKSSSKGRADTTGSSGRWERLAQVAHAEIRSATRNFLQNRQRVSFLQLPM